MRPPPAPFEVEVLRETVVRPGSRRRADPGGETALEAPGQTLAMTVRLLVERARAEGQQAGCTCTAPPPPLPRLGSLSAALPACTGHRPRRGRGRPHRRPRPGGGAVIYDSRPAVAGGPPERPDRRAPGQPVDPAHGRRHPARSGGCARRHAVLHERRLAGGGAGGHGDAPSHPMVPGAPGDWAAVRCGWWVTVADALSGRAGKSLRETDAPRPPACRLLRGDEPLMRVRLTRLADGDVLGEHAAAAD